MKKLIIAVVVVVLALSAFGAATNTRAAAPGCPAGLWTNMSKELASACKGEMAGKVVTMTGPQVAEDEVKFNASMKSFQDWTGITLKFTGSKEFEAAIKVAVDSGATPDIADFPQPGLLAGFAAKGKILDISTFMDPDWLKKNYNQSWLDMASMAGKDGKKIMTGVWHRFFGKDLVWYPKKAWDAAGYKVPQTWDELLALSAQIKKDGAAPWCVGIESGAATGWAATDWMEAILLRTAPLETYDNWTIPADPAKRVKFTDPAIKNAATKMADIWFADGFVYGGRKSIAGTNFGDAPKPMFDNPPKCYLHKQGNFITSFFPKGTTAGVDYVLRPENWTPKRSV